MSNAKQIQICASHPEGTLGHDISDSMLAGDGIMGREKKGKKETRSPVHRLKASTAASYRAIFA